MGYRVDRSGAFGAEIVIEGLEEMMEALGNADEKAEKEIKRRLRRIGLAIRDKAEGSVHRRSGRSGRWYSTRTKQAGTRVAVHAASAVPAIFEFAAVPHCRQGASLIATLNAQYGSPGRILWKAFDAERGSIEREAQEIVEDAERIIAAGGAGV